jgi:predicted phage terminase large subunit-like protein
LEQIRQASRYNFSGQYMQTPSPEEGGEWRKHWFEIINKSFLPSGLKYDLIIDGAYTKDTQNDPTGLQVGVKYLNDYYILSSIDKYLEMPELIKFIPSYIESLGVNIKMIYVEPKASGKSIKQLIQSQTNLNITEIKSKFVGVSKIERARTSSPYCEGGRVKLIQVVTNDHFLDQVAIFPNGKHDEHIDLTCYAIEQNLINKDEVNVTYS